MIPFTRSGFAGNELKYLEQVISSGYTAGDGPFGKSVEALLSHLHAGSSVLLTSSGTHALELAGRLLNLQPGQEVIVPSFTFPSTAAAFLWNGARPVFADVSPGTLCLNPDSVRSRISNKTAAICVVHYGGIADRLDQILDIAESNRIPVIEDNAHGLGGKFLGETLGTFGAMSILSFHDTKNVSCGEGGALVVNEPSLLDRAEILREKGTDRSRFLRGQVDKYTWRDHGSSWVLSDIQSSVLLGQLERLEQITQSRTQIWETYKLELEGWASDFEVRLPEVPVGSIHPGHLFYMQFKRLDIRDLFINHMRANGIHCVFHYQPLHLSPMGQTLDPDVIAPVSELAGDTLVRLPIYASMSTEETKNVISAVKSFIK